MTAGAVESVQGGAVQEFPPAAAWPRERIPEAVAALARVSGLARRPTQRAQPKLDEGPRADGIGDAGFERWVETCAHHAGLRVEPTIAGPEGHLNMVLHAGPALIRIPPADPATEGRVVALVGARQAKSPQWRSRERDRTATRVTVLTTDLALKDIPAAALASALAAFTEQGASLDELEPMLSVMNLPRERSARVRTALSREIAAGREQEIANQSEAWLLRSSGDVPFRAELRRAGAVRLGSSFLGAHFLQYGLWILGWVILGRGALSGRVDPGWMAAWALVLGTLVPLQLAGAWFQSRLAASVAAQLKTRLLRGAMRLDPDSLRREGAGFLFGRVVEAETFESLALGGAFPALVGVVELPIAMAIIAAGTGGMAHVLVLCAFVAIAATAGAVLHRARDRVTEARLDLTRGLVERMLGHRTRLVQLPAERWSENEDPELVRYSDLSRHMDRWTAMVGALPRGWFIAGLACLAWPWMRAADPTGLAIGLGGTLLAADSLANLVTGLPSLSGAIIAWRRVAPVVRAAEIGDSRESALPTTYAFTSDRAAPESDSHPLLSVKNITYQYPGRVHPALVAASLAIDPGDRVLITGPSGGGKSTLLALVAGLRTPNAGSIRFRGLARDTMGSAAWQRRILAVPQFHENHILSESLAFNLLMGRAWPPRAGDLELASQVCAELGLGDLIERMPSGLLQPVGESGWELSHGERSRVFLARAILQGADLVLLDETFGALDPESLSRSLTAALERFPTLLIVAHP